ncbi:DUF2516 family protein [Oryzihumus sp.]|uniref:DUF2516 family protein n=1 Tax=Oryzihumus sp. TaxID=1968903 RepID=UPI002EDA9CBB
MFNAIGTAQSLITVVLGVIALGMEVFALVDALRHRPDAYVAAGKRTKNLWVAVTAVAAVLGFVYVFNVLGFLSILAIVAAGFYLADVRPALRRVTGRGTGSQQGPYGPW